MPTRRAATSAKRLRQTMSPPEVMVWSALRLRPCGLKFRRQHPVGPYVLDFYCAEARLAVEVDGAAHDMGDQPERDRRRDAWLADSGIAMLRVAARAVLTHETDAVQAIIDTALARRPLHRLAAGPRPLAGEA